MYNIDQCIATFDTCLSNIRFRDAAKNLWVFQNVVNVMKSNDSVRLHLMRMDVFTLPMVLYVEGQVHHVSQLDIITLQKVQLHPSPSSFIPQSPISAIFGALYQPMHDDKLTNKQVPNFSNCDSLFPHWKISIQDNWVIILWEVRYFSKFWQVFLTEKI